MSDYQEELTALRKFRDGRVPFSSDSFRKVKSSHPELPKETIMASRRRNSIRPLSAIDDITLGTEHSSVNLNGRIA